MKSRISNLPGFDVLAILFIAAIIRLFGITSLYIADESMWPEAIKFFFHNGIFDAMTIVPHPPLAVLIYSAFTSVLGASIAGVRAVPLIFGIGTMYLAYLLARQIYGRMTALIALSLMAFSFYPVWSSLYVDIDGSLLAFFVTSTIYYYSRFRGQDSKEKEKEKEKKNRVWLRMAAISFGLALLTKYTAVLAIPIILLAEFLGNGYASKADLKRAVVKSYPVLYVLFFGLLMFSVFPAYSFISGNWESFLGTFSYGADTVSTNSVSSQVHSAAGILTSFAKNAFFILQYATPLIPILAVLALWNRNSKEWILISWVAVFFAFYTILVPGGGKVRYLMMLIPPLYILAAKGLSGVFADLRKKDTGFIAVASIVFLVAIVFLNTYGIQQSFNLQKVSTSTILQNGFLWYGGHGSAPFAIHVHSFIFVVAASAVLFAVSFMKKYFRIAMFLALALSIAFNGFILFQSFHPTAGPEYEKTVSLVASDLRDSSGPIYGIAQFRNALNVYLGDERVDYYEAGKRGTLVLIDLQLLENPVFQENYNASISKCSLKKTYYSADSPFAYIYDC